MLDVVVVVAGAVEDVVVVVVGEPDVVLVVVVPVEAAVHVAAASCTDHPAMTIEGLVHEKPVFP